MADISYVPGALVILKDLKAGAKAVPADSRGNLDTDFNGALAQLVQHHEASSRWLVTTMQGTALLLDVKTFRLATSSDLKGLDLVFGPASEPHFVAQRLCKTLIEKGFATIGAVVASKDTEELHNAASRLDQQGLFKLMPKQFVEGFQGKGETGKFYTLNSTHMDAAQEKLAQPFKERARNFTAFSQMLSKVAAEEFGFNVHSSTPLTVTSMFKSDAERSGLRARVPTILDLDAFLGIMHRRRVGMMEFLGPGRGTVWLSRRGEAEDDGFEVDASPGTILVFLTDQYDFSYSQENVDNGGLILSQWFLDTPSKLILSGEVEGDLSALNIYPATGPAPPRGDMMALMGWSHRNPGKADNWSYYWQGVNNGGCDGMILIPHSRYDMDMYCDHMDRDRAVSSGKMYSRHQGHLEGIDYFDPAFFSLSKAEALGMDPEQRLTLEGCYVAMATSPLKYTRDKLTRSSAHVGVYVGISGSDWHFVPLPPDAAGGMGGSEAIIAGRVTFALNLKGPAMIINTACSASLVSTHSARMQLFFKPDKLDAALSTGISINTTYHVFYGNCTTGALSFMGRSFSFNASADGFGRSEGTSAGYWEMTGYSDSDDMCGIVMGSQNNHDGRSASLTAPNGPAQERCVRSVLDETGIEPPEIDSFECHGTGTSLGDPIEVGAFKRLYNRKKRYNPVLATTSKTNLGHTEGGAGIAGLFKCMLMLTHSRICPNIHLRELNPHLDMDAFPVYFVSESVRMSAVAGYAGVSSFGVSGTNGHVMAYSKNKNSSASEKPITTTNVMMLRIRQSLPSISQTGSNWEDWTTMGRPYDPNPGSLYQVSATKDGTITWREVDTPGLKSHEGPFFVRGSFNKWDMELMDPDQTTKGLHTREVETSADGEVSFQIVFNYEEDKVFYPDEELCQRRTAQILGPGRPRTNDQAWLIQDEPEAFYRIEFFASGNYRSVSWFRIPDW